jgi:hypothetical protein
MMDSSFNVIGKWKRLPSADKKWGFKSEFQISPQANGLTLAADYRGKDFTAQFSTMNFNEFNAAYTQAITPSISAGVELTHALMMASFLGKRLAARHMHTVLYCAVLYCTVLYTQQTSCSILTNHIPNNELTFRQFVLSYHTHHH